MAAKKEHGKLKVNINYNHEADGKMIFHAFVLSNLSFQQVFVDNQLLILLSVCKNKSAVAGVF